MFSVALFSNILEQEQEYAMDSFLQHMLLKMCATQTPCVVKVTPVTHCLHSCSFSPFAFKKMKIQMKTSLN